MQTTQRRLGGATFPVPSNDGFTDLPVNVSESFDLIPFLLAAPSQIEVSQNAYNHAKQSADARKVQVIAATLGRFEGSRSNEETRKAAWQLDLSNDLDYIQLYSAEAALESAYTRAKNEFEAAKLVAEIFARK